MSAGEAISAAVIFVWLGMVLAISFLETPLKFRAPDVTLRIGLGIGRLVFRALNTVESVLAVVIVLAVLIDPPAARAVAATAVAVVALITQIAIVRPRLTRRTDAVLAGRDAPRSRSHYAYIALETAKVLALVVGGGFLLAV